MECKASAPRLSPTVSPQRGSGGGLAPKRPKWCRGRPVPLAQAERGEGVRGVDGSPPRRRRASRTATPARGGHRPLPLPAPVRRWCACGSAVALHGGTHGDGDSGGWRQGGEGGRGGGTATRHRVDGTSATAASNRSASVAGVRAPGGGEFAARGRGRGGSNGSYGNTSSSSGGGSSNSGGGVWGGQRPQRRPVVAGRAARHGRARRHGRAAAVTETTLGGGRRGGRPLFAAAGRGPRRTVAAAARTGRPGGWCGRRRRRSVEGGLAVTDDRRRCYHCGARVGTERGGVATGDSDGTGLCRAARAVIGAAVGGGAAAAGGPASGRCGGGAPLCCAAVCVDARSGAAASWGGLPVGGGRCGAAAQGCESKRRQRAARGGCHWRLFVAMHGQGLSRRPRAGPIHARLDGGGYPRI